MKTLILEKSINSKELLNFLQEYIYEASVVRMKNTSLKNIPESVLDEMKKDFRKYIDEECTNFPEEIKQEYERLYQEGIYEEDECDEDIKMLNIDSPEVTDYKFRRYSENSVGAIYEMIYLKKGKILDEILKQINDIFDMPFYIEELEEEFSDLTLYDETKKTILIISHEEYAELNLTDRQYEEFKKLKISKKFNVVDSKLDDGLER